MNHNKITKPISVYPTFRKLVLSDKELVDSYLGKNILPSESYFSILYCWNKPNRYTYISELNNNLIIKSLDLDTKKYVISVVGDTKIVHTLQTLLKDFRIVKFLSQECIENYKLSELASNQVIEEDIHDADYIYSTEDLAGLNGGKHKNRRWVINKFSNTYQDIKIKSTNKLSTREAKRIQDLFDIWESAKANKDSRIDFEKIAYARFIKHREYFNALFNLIYIKNKLVAVCVNDVSSVDCSLFCFMKADTHNYSHILSYAFYQNASSLFSRGVKYMNAESDLGIPSLHTFKQLWRPDFLIKKFSIVTANK